MRRSQVLRPLRALPKPYQDFPQVAARVVFARPQPSHITEPEVLGEERPRPIQIAPQQRDHPATRLHQRLQVRVREPTQRVRGLVAVEIRVVQLAALEERLRQRRVLHHQVVAVPERLEAVERPLVLPNGPVRPPRQAGVDRLAP